MTPPRSLIGNLAVATARHPWRRRLALAALALLLALLAVFPRTYRAVASLTPTDPASLGLSTTLGQFGAFGNVFGNQAAIEIGLKVARSRSVRDLVSKRLDLVRTLRLDDAADADRWLQHNVDIRSLRGGILQIEAKLPDPAFAQRVVGAFADATGARLAEISRRQTAYKRDLLLNLVRQSSARVNRAQAAYDAFRRRTRYAAPGPAIGAIGARIPSIQAAIKAREVELRAARAFATDDNIAVRQILAQLQALRSQLAEAESLDARDPDSVNRVVVQSTEVIDLELELSIARALRESYRRYLEGTAVEDLTATGNVRVLEPPYVDTTLQFRTLPAALLLLVLLLGVVLEVYLLRPPVGDRASRDPARA